MPDRIEKDEPGRSEEAHEKEQGEGLGKPDAPPGQEDKEPEVEPLTSPTSNDVGEQTRTKADIAAEEGEASA